MVSQVPGLQWIQAVGDLVSAATYGPYQGQMSLA